MSRFARLVLLAAAFVACRDEPTLHEPPELEPLGPAPYRLTFSPGREVTPTWSASGDEVIYLTRGLRFEPGVVIVTCPPSCGEAHPDSPVDSIPVLDTLDAGGLVRSIPRAGGVSRLLLPGLQGPGSAVAFAFAAQASSGRVAVLTRLPLLDRSLCGEVSACDTDLEAARQPRLAAAFIRARDPEAGTPPDQDPLLSVTYPGREFDTSETPHGLEGIWRVDRHPFQDRFSATRHGPDRLSWSPEGDRVAFSDGVALHTWNPDTGELFTIPNTADGIDPAWSPTGEWIAFERLARGGEVEELCEHRVVPGTEDGELGAVVCVERRRSWMVVTPSLAIVRPDGSDLRLLPPGSRPAWGPDGRRIYYEAGGEIRSTRIDEEGVFSVVPNTQNGFEPAVSPDGAWLAFSRVDPATLAADIWIVRIGP